MPAKRRQSRETADENATLEENAPAIQDDTPHVRTEGRRWYAVHTYSGYENKVKSQLEARAQTMHLTDRIFQVLVPVEEVMEVRNGERRTVRRKIFPSYIMVDMILDDETWHCVKQTPGVTSFVGGANAMEPIPLQEHEIASILRQARQSEEDAGAAAAMPRFTIGQSVKIIDGPFADFIGQINEVHPESNKITVLVSFFNRETPVELSYFQVEKV